MSAALVALSFGAVKLCVASAMAIVCGWQPMPDGSPSYECVVQLEPELLNSLKHGDSIPLSVEVPENVRPISRIRITVGKGELPQQMLATQYKPWPADEKQSRDGVVETQFSTNAAPANNGYGIQQAVNQQVAPVAEYISNTQNEFARSLQNGGQAVRDAAAQATQDILPPDPGRSISNAVDRAGQQLGNNLQTVGETVQEDIRQMFSAEPAASTSAILPPGNANVPQAGNGQSQQILPVDPNTATNNRRRLDQPISSNQANDWQSSTANGTNTAVPTNANSTRGVFNAPWPEVQAPQNTATNNANVGTPTGDRYGGATAFSTSNGSILPQNNGSPITQNDRYGNTSQPQNGGFTTADNRSGQGTNNQSTNSAGPAFPEFTPSRGDDRSPITPTPSQTQASSSPEIRRDMLNQPANAEIQGANGLPIGQQVVTNAQTPNTPPTTANTSAASNFNWPQTPSTTAQSTAPSDGIPAGPVFPLLLSWVLLSGSGAGNLYLFWSYLDVRNKYRDLVDEASRRISGRRARD